MIPSASDSSVVELCPGLQCQWLGEGRVLAFLIKATNRETVDAWFKARTQAVWPPDQPVLVMYEMTVLPLIPYARKRIDELTRLTASVHGRTAIVLRPSIFANIIRAYLDHDISKNTPHMLRRVFFSRDAALEWLLPKE